VLRRGLLSTEELIRELGRLGIDISERTIKFYVSHDLLPKPRKDSSGKRDRRVVFFHEEAVRAVQEIRRLQGQGFTLDQIKKFLTGAEDPQLRALADEQRRAGRFTLAEKFVKALFSDASRAASREFLERSVRDLSEDALAQAGREYYRAVLTALMGEEEAQTYISEVLERLTPGEWEKKIAPLRQLRDAAVRNMKEAAGTVGSTLTGQLQDLGRGLIVGAERGASMRELEGIERRLKAMEEKYGAVPVQDAPRREIAAFMLKALAVYGEAVALLKDYMAQPEAARVELAIARAERAGEIMGHLEAMVREKQELLRLCQEEDLRIY
jgi:DNA-binding transcriptional MerR regulator